MEPEDLFVAPVNSFEEAFKDPQAMHNNMVVDVESPIGTLKLMGLPYKLSKTPASIRTAPPLHGQHTDEILAEFGFSSSEIEELRNSKTI